MSERSKRWRQGPKSPYGRAGNHRIGLGRAVRPCSSPAIRSSAGAEPRVRPCRPARAPQANVEASSVGGGGPRHLVRRDDSPWLTGGSPSGTEVSSGPPDSRRSPGRGVEEARGSPRAGTPGNPGSPTFITTVRYAQSPRSFTRQTWIERLRLPGGQSSVRLLTAFARSAIACRPHSTVEALAPAGRSPFIPQAHSRQQPLS